MVRFLKKIKQNLLDRKKIRQYLFYAIGEVILVMIGILLALQVNNWNEQRKQNQAKKDNLTLMVEDLKSDIESLKKQESLHLKFFENNKKAIQIFNKANTIKDIRKVISIRYFEPDELSVNNPTFEEMLSSGNLNIIKNKKLSQTHSTEQQKVIIYILLKTNYLLSHEVSIFRNSLKMVAAAVCLRMRKVNSEPEGTGCI